VFEALHQRGVDLPIRHSISNVISMNAELGNNFSSELA
jgi:hypothetical protein